MHGDARGADRIARDIWRSHGLTDEPHPALWKLNGRQAGPIRNAQMVDAGADVCLAFPLPQSVGSYDCIRRAHSVAIPTHIYEPSR